MFSKYKKKRERKEKKRKVEGPVLKPSNMLSINTIENVEKGVEKILGGWRKI